MGNVWDRGNNRWELNVDVGRGKNNKRIRRRKTVYAINKTEATKKLRQFEREIETGEYINVNRMTFGEFIKEWDVRYAQKELAPSTQKVSHELIRGYIMEEFKYRQMQSINAMQIKVFMDKMAEPSARKDGSLRPLSPNTQANIYKTLKNIFTRAKEWKVIHEHPMEGIKKPKVPASRAEQYLDEDDIPKVLAALFEEPIQWRLYYVTAIFSGLRRGELTVLEWNDIDFEEHTIRVDKSLSAVDNGVAYIGKPKTFAAQGEVQVPEWLIEEFRNYRAHWLQEKMEKRKEWEEPEFEYIFHNGFGSHYHEDTPTKRWKSFIRKHDFPDIRLHDLRHTTATLLLSQDVPLKDIQATLRHSKYQTTADIYTHVTKKRKKRTASVFDQFNPKQMKK